MRRGLVIGVFAVLAAGQAFAHHSGAMYDRSKLVTIKGVLKEYQFVAPHSWISVIGSADGQGGEPERWDVEGGSASRMAAQGITPARLKVGDKVTIRCHPLRDGRHGGTLVDVVLEDGTLITNDVTRLPVGQ